MDGLMGLDCFVPPLLGVSSAPPLGKVSIAWEVAWPTDKRLGEVDRLVQKFIAHLGSSESAICGSVEVPTWSAVSWPVERLD